MSTNLKQRVLSFDSVEHYHLCVRLQANLADSVSHFRIDHVRELLDVLELHHVDICNGVEVPELVAWCSNYHADAHHDGLVVALRTFIANYL